jgi:succinate dehydrogenase/fumarate reductase-like Fe-S protein
VPVEFLSDDQAAAYERFVGDLSRSELEGFFLLDSTALDLIANKRGDHNRWAWRCRSGRCGTASTSWTRC